MYLADEGTPSPTRLGLTMLGGYLAAGGAGALNCYFDRDIDGGMERTCHRALPAGRLEPHHALGWGLLLGVLSALVLWFGAHPLAAVLALLALLHYVLVYTLWLKRRSPQNVIIGGLAGAAPPLVGWAAVNGTLSLEALVLAAIVFFWTPAHFWALALMRRAEYGRMGIPMLPVVSGEGVTHRQILKYVGATALLTALPLLVGSRGTVYAVGAALLDGLFLHLGLRVLRRAHPRATRQFYFFSLVYLAALFLVMLIDYGL
jgi:protoheme IX farnesyltransferase